MTPSRPRSLRALRRLPATLAGVCLLALSGCATTATDTPRHDATFGRAVLSARALQTINPEAPSAPPAAAGMDGRAGRAAIEHYQGSFRSPPPSFNVINIGGGLGTGQ